MDAENRENSAVGLDVDGLASALSDDLTDREVDLEIVSNSWLSLTESEGFDRMMESWSRKIEPGPGGSSENSSLVDNVVARQLAPIERLLSSDTELRSIDPLEKAAKASACPTIVLSPDGTVVTVANGGASLFGVRAGHMAGTDWLDERSAGDFEALRRSARERGNISYAVLRVKTGGDNTGGQNADGLAEANTVDFPDYAGTFTIIRSLEFDWQPLVGEKLIQAFSLTPAEVEICRLLFRFRDLDTVSRHRGVTRETGRTQLKRIFAKTEIHSKAELIRLLAMLCSRKIADDNPRDLNWADPLGRERLVKRPDGRKLAYSWIGAEHGRPALFVHGELPLFYLDAATQDMLAAQNVKLLCLSMPGHGSSDPPPEGMRQLDDGIAAIEMMVRRLGGKPIPMVASYSGMVYPMVLGSRAEALLSAIVLIGMPWNVTPEAYKQLPAIQKTMAQMAKRSPRMFDLVCRLGWKMIMREGPDFYLHRALTGSQVDLDTVSDADKQPYLRAACRHLVAQGHTAFVRETIKGAGVEPANLLAGLRVPLHWLVPEEEPTGGRDNQRAVKAMNPNITVETIPGAGELVPYQRPDVFVRCMADLVSDDPETGFAQAENFGTPA